MSESNVTDASDLHSEKQYSQIVFEPAFDSGGANDGVEGFVHYRYCPAIVRLSLRFFDIGNRGAAANRSWIARRGAREGNPAQRQ
jgi:hypothetical protein